MKKGRRNRIGVLYCRRGSLSGYIPSSALNTAVLVVLEVPSAEEGGRGKRDALPVYTPPILNDAIEIRWDIFTVVYLASVVAWYAGYVRRYTAMNG